MTRPIHTIAAEINRDWQKVNYSAAPYLDAMHGLSKITDNYGLDSASNVVARFLSNAGSWRGEVARRVKLELKEMMK